MQKILLIEPPFCRLFKPTYSLEIYPLALGYLAGKIKKDTAWQVMTYNADFSPENERMKFSYLATTGFKNYLESLEDFSSPVWREIEACIKEYKPSVVGISAKSQNFRSACNVAKIAKGIASETIVIVGGPHPSMVGAEVLKCPDIDIGVRGEGENTIVELLEIIGAKRELEKVKGITYKKNGRFIENDPREYIDDLDSLPFPHETAEEILKDYDKYPVTAFRNIFTIRGCPYNCFFCGSRKIWSRKTRFRSHENIIREIKALQEKGVQSVRFDDDTFGVSKKRIGELCDALANSCPGLKWSCELHVNLVDDKTISAMKNAGCHSIQIGIESGNNEILKKIRKNISIEEAIEACKIIKKNGINLETFFMVGFPQETEETLKDTFTAMKKVNADNIIYNIFNPYPGTEAFELCKENGLIDDHYDCSLHNHHSPNNCFCINIPPERFRMLCSEIEKWTDREMTINRIKKIFSSNTIWRVKELGLRESAKKGVKIFLGR